MKTIQMLLAAALAIVGMHQKPPSLQEALEAAIQDEYKSQAYYTYVLEKQGQVRPFSMIVRSEGMHIQALKNTFERHGLTAPESEVKPEDFKPFATLQEACQAAVEIENYNIALYERYLQEELPADVRNLFEALQGASRDHHLWAFTRCSQGMGGGMGPGGGRGPGGGPGWQGGRGMGIMGGRTDSTQVVPGRGRGPGNGACLGIPLAK